MFQQAVSDYHELHWFVAKQALAAILFNYVWFFGSFRLFSDLIISILMLSNKTQRSKMVHIWSVEPVFD